MAMVLNDDNFTKEVLGATDMPIIVDFWAEWCVPCKMLSPILDEVANSYQGKLKYGKLETDDSPNTSLQFDVMSIPTVIAFKNGKEVNRMVGLQTKEAIMKFIEDIL